MRVKELLFGGAGGATSTADAGLAAYRLSAGLAIALLHGIGKVPPSEGFAGMIGGMGLPAPELFAWLAAFAELGGGLLLAIGLLTRPAAVLLFGHFAFVVLLAHGGEPLGDRELPLIFWATALMFMLTGAGRYSVDALLQRGTGVPRR